MKIAFTAQGTDWDSQMEARFGRADYFFIYDEAKDTVEIVDNKSSENEAHGAGPKAAQSLANHNVNVLITGNGPGGNAATVLQKVGVECYIKATEMTIKQAYEAFKNAKLEKF
jgi:predicted Fe-Mo cluster-binding NifX family protein